MEEKMEQQKVRPAELARILSVHPRTIRKWQAMRVIPFVKVGNVILFDVPEVHQALDEFKTKVER